jgi:hypothetical protein
MYVLMLYVLMLGIIVMICISNDHFYMLGGIKSREQIIPDCI